jgi:hypothetical protein
MKRLKVEMQWVLGLLVDEKKTRRSKSSSEVEWKDAEQTQLARHCDFRSRLKRASRSLLVSTDE